MKRFRLFISSVQKELQGERYAIRDYVHGDSLLRRYFDVFLFEDLPASDRRADNVYLEEVDRCGVYVGLFGREYGNENDEGLSPTEREFDHATAKGKLRLVFVKGTDDKARQPKMLKLVSRAGRQVTRRRFSDTPGLNGNGTFEQRLLKIHLKSMTFQPVLSQTNYSPTQTCHKRIIPHITNYHLF